MLKIGGIYRLGSAGHSGVPLTLESTMPWIIRDWAGNVKFSGLSFATFQDAWDFICEQVPDENDHQDFFAVTV